MKNSRYNVSWLQICPFERLKSGLLKPNREDYPYRLCVVDKKSGNVIDVKTNNSYKYIHTSSIYFMHEEAKKIIDGKRYAIRELQSSMFSISEEDLKLAREIINKLNNNIDFVDGNEVLSNEQYLEIIKEKNNKVKMKEKKGYYEYKRNNK